MRPALQALAALVALLLLAPHALEAKRKVRPKAVSVKRNAKVASVKRNAKAARGRSASRTARASRPPAPSTPSPDRLREIQQALVEKGHFTGPVTGQWGPDTVDAVRRFQQAQNLKVDGKLGARTLIALGLGPKRQEPGEQGALLQGDQPQ